MAYSGGTSPGDPEFDWLSFTTTREAWRVANRCDKEPKQTETATLRTSTYMHCAAPLVTIEHLGDAHVWHGARLANVWTQSPKASREVAEFFAKVAP